MAAARVTHAAEDRENLAGLTCVEENPRGGSGEGGLAIKVYSRDDDVRYLDWQSESGNKITRREFRFKRRILISVVETIHSKGDRHTGVLKHPRLVSTTKFDVEDPACERRNEFLQQARQLLADFRDHRAAFHPCGKAE